MKNDAVLIPLYVALRALSVWLLYRSGRSRERLGPFWRALAGALFAFLGLWTSSLPIYAGLVAIVAASVADFVNARRPTAQAR